MPDWTIAQSALETAQRILSDMIEFARGNDMSMVVEISNTSNLRRARTLLGAKSDGETLELALEKVIEVYEPKKPERQCF